MNFISALIFIYIFIAKASPKNVHQRTIPVVDALIPRLEGEEWADDEEACFRSTLRILNGVKNDTLWATWIWDAMQPPVGVFYGTGFHLGNFDQCIDYPWTSQLEMSTQYCLVEVKGEEPMEPKQFSPYDSANEYLNTLTDSRRKLIHLGFGLCMPGVCSSSSVTKIFKHMLQLTHMPDVKEIILDPNDCQSAEQKPYPGKFYAFFYACGALFSIALISTIYLNYNKNKTETSRIDDIAKSFSLFRNWKNLFKGNKNEIEILNGMRVYTAMFVVGTHQGLFSLFSPAIMNNSAKVDSMFKHEVGQGIYHLDLIVDTFLPMSGLLLMKTLMSGRQKNLLVVLAKRYFRLIGPYILVTFYILCVARYTGSGPIWLKSNSNEEEVCEKYWWKNFFMLGYDMKTMCFGVAWYVNCDFHLAIMTILLFWVYRRSRRAGILVFLTVSCLLTVQLAIMAYRKRVPLVPFAKSFALTDIRNNDVMNDVYIRWHDRAGSYLVGIAMGWLMSIYKPADHRRVISRTFSYIILMVSLYVMMKTATINFWLSEGSRVEVAIALATNRVVWSVAICAIIGACEYGCLGLVDNMLGTRFFAPIGKLSYGIYMTHFFILQRNVHTVRSTLTFDFFNIIITVLGVTALSWIVGLIIYLIVEGPCINLSNLYLTERTNKAELNGTKPTNGTIHQNGTNGITKLKES